MNRMFRLLLVSLLSVSSIISFAGESRPGQSVGRPGGSASKQERPSASSSARPTTRPGMSVERPGVNKVRPTTPSVKPSTPANRPGDSSVRPGGSSARPGSSTVRPGSSSVRPGNSASRPGSSTVRPGNSVPRPGSWNPVTPPHDRWSRPGYRPAHPSGGYWGIPASWKYRRNFWIPPTPPRYYYATGVPTLGTILGLTFGSFIDAGINSLFNAGYNVAGYQNGIIYLSSVSQLGYTWPEATMNYTDGLLTSSQFTYVSTVPSKGRFNGVYSKLCSIYGAPAANTGNTVTWWAGEATGYITLHYAYANSMSGLPGYYTTLTYSVNY